MELVCLEEGDINLNLSHGVGMVQESIVHVR